MNFLGILSAGLFAANLQKNIEMFTNCSKSRRGERRRRAFTLCSQFIHKLDKKIKNERNVIFQ